ncbi:MAG: hypothetical protein PHS41_08035 [Victivallaceae bacterium]|nr:hypothetical protein [Victivallaceae bacterium]
MNLTIRKLTGNTELESIRRIAADIWPKTFRTILSPEQITYMMQMMYAPEVMAGENFDRPVAHNVAAKNLCFLKNPSATRILSRENKICHPAKKRGL